MAWVGSQDRSVDVNGEGRMSGPKVVLILGVSRSGSTLLDLVLGANRGVVSTGELYHLFRRGLCGEEKCGCGALVKKCDYWSEVLKRSGIGAGDAASILGMQSLAQKAMARRVLGGRANERGGRAIEGFQRVMELVYGAIGDVAGAKIIVDSSKNPYYVGIVKELLGERALVVHLVRDSRAVAYSWHKIFLRENRSLLFREIASAIGSAWGWTWPNIVGEVVGRTAEKHMRLRYEDMVREPGKWIARIQEALDEGTEPWVVPERLVPAAHHTVSGNPMRAKSDAIVIRADEQWRARLPRLKRWIVTALTAPLLRRYGYL